MASKRKGGARVPHAQPPQLLFGGSPASAGPFDAAPAASSPPVAAKPAKPKRLSKADRDALPLPDVTAETAHIKLAMHRQRVGLGAALQAAAEAGRWVSVIRAKLRASQWRAWLVAIDCPIGERHARRCQRLAVMLAAAPAALRDELEQSGIAIDDAIRRLVAEVAARVDSGVHPEGDENGGTARAREDQPDAPTPEPKKPSAADARAARLATVTAAVKGTPLGYSTKEKDRLALARLPATLAGADPAAAEVAWKAELAAIVEIYAAGWTCPDLLTARAVLELDAGIRARLLPLEIFRERWADLRSLAKLARGSEKRAAIPIEPIVEQLEAGVLTVTGAMKALERRAKSPAEQACDKMGNPLPDGLLVPYFAHAEDQLRAVVTAVGAARTAINKAAAWAKSIAPEGKERYHTITSSVVSLTTNAATLDRIVASVQQLIPHSLCPTCDGGGQEPGKKRTKDSPITACVDCSARGFLTFPQWESLHKIGRV